MKKIVGFVGLIGSGKDTAADVLCEHDYVRDSFAHSLKDVTAAIFGWDRNAVEGRTLADRAWRETVDEWWASRLSMPDLTPRRALQVIGTQVLRGGFHDDIWLATLEKRFHSSDNNIVISDVRFPNEISIIHKLGGRVIRIQRGPEPFWMPYAIAANSGDRAANIKMVELGIHQSEWAWAGQPVDLTITNDGTLAEFQNSIRFRLLAG